MAVVSCNLARPEHIVPIDARDLLEDGQQDSECCFDPLTGAPKRLRAIVICKDPRMTVVPNFLSPQECDHLVSLADGNWMPSMIGQATHTTETAYAKGDLENAYSQTRTSWSCMLRYSQTDVVERIEHRLSSLTGLPLDQLERMNMVRYAPGEHFDEHHDGKFRPITVFVYLNDLPPDDDRGDTFFPHLGLRFLPSRGTAVMWSNVDQDTQQEDSRMLHAGRAPLKGVKYGVNCFTNVKGMRKYVQHGPDCPVDKATLVTIADLRDDECGAPTPDQLEMPEKRQAFRLSKDPKLLAMPGFLTPSEVEDFLQLLPTDVDQTRLPGAGTQILRVLQFAESPTISRVEQQLAKFAGLHMDNLARLRLVQPATALNHCNRGCGPKSVYVCLCDHEEIFFPRLGIRLHLQMGDAVQWVNVNWDTEAAVEDLRTLRVHRGWEGAAPARVGVDAYFHDNSIRAQQSKREFVSDDEVAERASFATAVAAE